MSVVLSKLLEELASGRLRVVDLTQPLSPQTPLLPLPPLETLFEPLLFEPWFEPLFGPLLKMLLEPFAALLPFPPGMVSHRAMAIE